MGEKFDVIVQLRLVQHGIGPGIDLAAIGAGADRLHRRLLDRFDFSQEVFKLGVRLADDAHAGKVADIALIVAS